MPLKWIAAGSASGVIRCDFFEKNSIQKTLLENASAALETLQLVSPAVWYAVIPALARDYWQNHLRI